MSQNFPTGRNHLTSKQSIEKCVTIQTTYKARLSKSHHGRQSLWRILYSEGFIVTFKRIRLLLTRLSESYDNRCNGDLKHMASLLNSLLSWVLIKMSRVMTRWKYIPWTFCLQTWKILWRKWRAQWWWPGIHIRIRAEVPSYHISRLIDPQLTNQ